MSNPDIIRARIEETRRGLGADVDALADKVSPSHIAERQKDKVRDTITSAKETIMGGIQPKIDAAADAAADPSAVTRTAAGHPLVVGLIAFGAGWLLSSLLPTTESEQRLAGSVKDKAAPLTDTVKNIAQDAGQQVVDDLQGPAKEAARSVKSTAADAAQTVKQQSQAAADDVKGAAGDATKTVGARAGAAKDALGDQTS